MELIKHENLKSEISGRKVPELSLSSYLHGSQTERARFSDNFYLGLKEYGFVTLKDHPIPISLLTEAYQLLEQLFSLPTENKRRYISPAGGGVRGYTPFGTEHAKYTAVPDLKEFWHVGREVGTSNKFPGVFAPNIWPEELPSFRTIFTKIYNELDEVGKIMLRSLTGPLDLPSSYFDDLVTEGNSILRLLHYPPIPAGADPRCVRAAAHEDINLITILVSASASGLELLDRDGKWLPVETDPNNLIVDSGDMLSRITNEVIPSTTHRVVNPADKNTNRYSMPFFMHPNPDALLSCIPSCVGAGAKFPDVLSQDFLMQRLREIGLIK